MRFRDKPWDRISLNEVCKVFDGTHQTPDYKKFGIKFVSVENINDLYNTDKFISEEDFYKDFKIYPKTDDILMTRIGDIGTPAIVSKNEKLAYYVSLALLRPDKNKLNTQFLKSYIETMYFKKELWNRTIHVAFPIKINKDEIGKCSICLPDIKLQEKIADIMISIDNRIEAQSKIINNLESLKVGIWDTYYKNMSTFNSVKLSDVLKERKEYCLKNETYPHATLSKDGVSGKTDRYNRDFLVIDDEKEYKVTYLNDICYNPANLKFGVICRNNFGSAIFSPIYVTYEVNKKYNVNFIEQVLTSNSFIQYIRKYEQGTVYERMAVNSEDFLKGFIKIPSIDEQNKITQIINNINLKLQKEKDILELYKKQKAYLLKNMFI